MQPHSRHLATDLHRHSPVAQCRDYPLGSSGTYDYCESRGNTLRRDRFCLDVPKFLQVESLSMLTAARSYPPLGRILSPMEWRQKTRLKAYIREDTGCRSRSPFGSTTPQKT